MRTRFWTFGLAGALWVLSGGAAHAARTFYVELRYSPQENVATSVPDLSADLFDRPVRLLVEDGRASSDPAVIGESSDDNDRVRQIRATNSVVEWSHEVLLKNARAWGINARADAPLTLVARLTRFFLDEGNKPVGSVYNADVRLAFELRDREGAVLASGTASGDATRYGRSRNADNSREVLSDAIKEAYAAMFSERRLQTAWRRDAGDERAAAKPPGSSGISPAELLQELLDLRTKGFSVEIMVDYVDNKTLSAPLSAGDMVRWKDAGMPEEVIRAAVNRAPS